MDNLQFNNFLKEEVVRHLRKNNLIKEVDNEMIDKVINVIIDNIKSGVEISHKDVHYFIKKIILNTCKYDIEKKYETCTEINNINKNKLVNSLCNYFDENNCNKIKELVLLNNNNIEKSKYSTLLTEESGLINSNNFNDRITNQSQISKNNKSSMIDNNENNL